MARTKRFAANLLSSYAAIGINVLYTIASVPLALHYLDKEEFGLWALVTQLSGYLMLLEFGMSGSVARSLSDHKDHIESGVYGSILKTGGRVFSIQGIIVFLLGVALARFAPSLLALPARLHAPFLVLMTGQAALTGGKLALGALASPLWCHQRLDLSNFAGSVSMLFTFAVLWLGFHSGWHLYSLPAATVVGTVAGLALTYFSCRRLGYYPPRAYRGRFDPKLFRELFQFGGGLFLMNLGAQLASASQVIVVSRLLGIEAAATWSVGTKIFGMAQQFVARILDSSAGGLAEMVVRNETVQLKRRFRDVVVISAVMAGAAGAGIALMNGPFIEIWTSGKVCWAPWNNVLLAFVLFCSVVTRCNTSLVGITKEIRGMKYVYLFEGIAFVLTSLALVPRCGLAGLMVAALLCNLGITGLYGIGRSADYFAVTWRVVVAWVLRPTIVMALVAALFCITRLSAVTALGPVGSFIAGALLFLLGIVPAIWLFALDLRLKSEFSSVFARFIMKVRSALRLA
jgi:O-antigen/teichoic acid export membrane protein